MGGGGGRALGVDRVQTGADARAKLDLSRALLVGRTGRRRALGAAAERAAPAPLAPAMREPAEALAVERHAR